MTVSREVIGKIYVINILAFMLHSVSCDQKIGVHFTHHYAATEEQGLHFFESLSIHSLHFLFLLCTALGHKNTPYSLYSCINTQG